MYLFFKIVFEPFPEQGNIQFLFVFSERLQWSLASFLPGEEGGRNGSGIVLGLPWKGSALPACQGGISDGEKKLLSVCQFLG